ncbi:MAG: hypothetical protein HC862_07940 [Scytonema sp. RU_4_4]|nr:hypothetical protein [Scytonema sp. RU_4_4]
MKLCDWYDEEGDCLAMALVMKKANRFLIGFWEHRSDRLTLKQHEKTAIGWRSPKRHCTPRKGEPLFDWGLGT